MSCREWTSAPLETHCSRWWLTFSNCSAYYRFRDREQVLAIALEANTPRLLHASIAVFYSTVHAVANASKLSDRVGDLQAFLDDLVKTCEGGKTGAFSSNDRDAGRAADLVRGPLFAQNRPTSSLWQVDMIRVSTTSFTSWYVSHGSFQCMRKRRTDLVFAL